MPTVKTVVKDDNVNHALAWGRTFSLAAIDTCDKLGCGRGVQPARYGAASAANDPPQDRQGSG